MTPELPPTPEPGEESRHELLVSATFYLMTHYLRTGCPKLAQCVARHMQCLATHKGSDPVLRDICSGLHGTWVKAGELPHPGQAKAASTIH